MTAYADPAVARPNPLVRAENWLDRRGRYAWIAAMVAGFVIVWPLGLALLAYMLWRNKFAPSGGTGGENGGLASFRGSSGNAAFDAYRAETLRRLEDEQGEFEAFLKRLREARDKAEFDQFMEDRARRSNDAPSEA